MLLTILMNSQTMSNKQLIVIHGPTAIGKTSLSIELAEYYNTEIISCDSRQFYKELKIGAAPPDPQELAAVKHHFIHHLSVTDNYNVGAFEQDAINKIEQLFHTYDKLIMVGGSGLYIDAVCKGMDEIPEISDEIRNKLNDDYNKKGLAWLQNQLEQVDLEFYTNCDKNNPKRLIRALEIIQQTGQSITSFHKKKSKARSFEIIKMGLKMDREQLYKRINSRVDIMIQKGLLDEVKSLTPYQNYNALQTVGYKELFKYLKGNTSLEESIEEIKKNSRRFAKRQITWFRRDDEIQWFDTNRIKDITPFI